MLIYVKMPIKAISHTHRNRTEKLKCLKPYGRFHICAETEIERRTENVHDFDFFFRFWWPNFSKHDR